MYVIHLLIAQRNFYKFLMTLDERVATKSKSCKIQVTRRNYSRENSSCELQALDAKETNHYRKDNRVKVQQLLGLLLVMVSMSMITHHPKQNFQVTMTEFLYTSVIFAFYTRSLVYVFNYYHLCYNRYSAFL